MATLNDDSSHHHAAGEGESSSLASMLEPLLRSACQERLSKVHWFRSAWQAGGAATGFAKFALDGADPVDVVVKLPVGPAEYRWTTSLGGMPHVSERITDGPIDGAEAHKVEVSPGYACAMGPTPHVYAAGTEIGGYDLAWLIVERFSGEPLNKHLVPESIEDLLNAAAEWYDAAERVKPIASATGVPKKDWPTQIERSLAIIPDCGIDTPHRWKEAVKTILKLLPRLISIWDQRPINTWCHGDLHPGNAMRRNGAWWFAGHRSPSANWRNGKAVSGCVLIDLALVHPGHWVEDAVYLERLFWSRSDLLGGIKPVSFLAQARRSRGLPTTEDYTLLANVRRVLMAASVPCFLTHEGHPKYVHAALEHLERLLPVLSRV